MAWFHRSRKNIEEQNSREMPDGLWMKCSGCDHIIYKGELEEHLSTCSQCNKHFRIKANDYLNLLFDNESFIESDKDVTHGDPLNFSDEISYVKRYEQAVQKTGLKEAITIGTGFVDGKKISIAAMDFSFIGGSMGSVVGEKFCRAIDVARKEKIPFVAIPASGGARMQEGTFSLLQMAKTSSHLTLLSEEGLPYIVILTDPTTGGVTASFAMLGDITIAEPGALVGFAGPRVIEQMTKKKLPPGFQRSEFQQFHGFVDIIVHRKELRSTLSRVLNLIKY